jgi:hypothetical protein
MYSTLSSVAAFASGAAFAACPAMFGGKAMSAGASVSASVSAFPAAGTGANGRLTIEFDELGQVRTVDTAAKTWTVLDRQNTEALP